MNRTTAIPFKILFYTILIQLGVGCQTEFKLPQTIQVKTYTNDAIDYANIAIQVPDSTRVQFFQNFFSPWNLTPENVLGKLDGFPGKKVSYLEKYLADDEWYGENKKPHQKMHRKAIVANSDLENFPNFLKRGITVAHTDIRRIPSYKPGYDTYSKAGEGHPFDYFQETAVWTNTPVFVLHITLDYQWCYVVSPIYKGWMPMQDVAMTDADFITEWKANSFCFPLSDGLLLRNETNPNATTTKLGMVLPYQEVLDTNNKVTVSFAKADEYQHAKILTALVDKGQLAFAQYPMNGTTLKPLVAQLLGRPYGWGGSLENRDCSSMIRDLLGTYGIWLPRDSKDQIDVGGYVEMPESTEEKMALIKEKGIPFLTILRKKGHNMLYVGNDADGTPLILHAIWGLKTSYQNPALGEILEHYPIEGMHQDDSGTLHGRHIIGAAVLTPVTLGEGYDQVTAYLLEDIYAMTTILE